MNWGWKVSFQLIYLLSYLYSIFSILWTDFLSNFEKYLLVYGHSVWRVSILFHFSGHFLPLYYKHSLFEFGRWDEPPDSILFCKICKNPTKEGAVLSNWNCRYQIGVYFIRKHSGQFKSNSNFNCLYEKTNKNVDIDFIP